MSLQGKIIAITGAGSGIGAASARKCVQSGASGLLLADLNSKPLEEVAAECRKLGATVITRRLDVTDASAVTSWITDGKKELGGFDGAVLCAGAFFGAKNLLETPRSAWDLCIQVNMTGVLNCLQVQIPNIATPGGSIVVISSASGVMGFPTASAYSASKFGVIGLTRSAAAEWGSSGIRINSIAPGSIETPMFIEGYASGATSSEMAQGNALKRLGKPHEIANAAAWLLSDESSFVTGSTMMVDGGLTA